MDARIGTTQPAYAIKKIGCQVQRHNTDKVVEQSTHLNAKPVNADLKFGLNRV